MRLPSLLCIAAASVKTASALGERSKDPNLPCCNAVLVCSPSSLLPPCPRRGGLRPGQRVRYRRYPCTTGTAAHSLLLDA